MKKIVTIILALILICSVALSEGIDWASMTDEEITAIIEAGQAELKSRSGGEPEEIVIMDYNGLTITASNFHVEDTLLYKDGALVFDVVIENNTDKSYDITGTDISINGWTVDALIYVDIMAGKKTKDVFKLDLGGADCKSLEDVQEIEFIFNVCDEDFNIDTSAPITVTF